MTNNTGSDPDFRFPSSPTHQIITNFVSASSPGVNFNHNPRKKRSKLFKVDDSGATTCCSGVSKPKYVKRPDPNAPKITMPCSECGKRFWSMKALFGHMRCHPERQWRGINPPPNFRRPKPVSPVKEISCVESMMTMEDHEAAASLLMLANGGADSSSDDGDRFYSITTTTTTNSSQQRVLQENEVNLGGVVSCRFECSSCKKVFGSHQALGGHRASHKNVKGCFAITKSDGCEVDGDIFSSGGIVKENAEDYDKNMEMVLGHKCSICLRVFSSGQALGGHKRCHWEKLDDPLMINILDLNLPAPVVDDSASSSYSSGLTLDLRLGL